MRLFKRGGIYFWNIGRIGGSFYCKRRAAVHQLTKEELSANPYRTNAGEIILLFIVGFTVAFGSLAIYAIDNWRLPTVAGMPVHYLSANLPLSFLSAGVVR